MINSSTYQFTFSSLQDSTDLEKGVWLAVLHASRIPPHLGLIINGNYNSLTIKERELNIPLKVLIKTITQKNIEALFFKLSKHPVFSDDYMLGIFQEQLKQFNSVGVNEATCLTPIKLFAEEFYAITLKKHDLFHDFLLKLEKNNYITEIKGINLLTEEEHSVFSFKNYTYDELQEKIRTEKKFNSKK